MSKMVRFRLASVTKCLLSTAASVLLFCFVIISFRNLALSHSSDFVLPQAFQENVYPPKPLLVTYVLRPWAVTNSLDKNFITYFVKSSPDNFMRRKMIRRTWASVKKIGDKYLTVIFLIGATPDDHVQNLVKVESNCFGDILQTNLSDTFHNLTFKTLSAFKWISTQFQRKSDFYVFSDDDCVINVRNTLNFLVTTIPIGSSEKQVMYCGFMYEKCSGVIRGNGKLSLQRSQYTSDILPPFCRGVMVVLTYKMVTDLYAISQVTHYEDFPLDDVMIYGILREKLNQGDANIYPVINKGHPLVFYPWSDGEAVVEKMAMYWKSLKNKPPPDRNIHPRGSHTFACLRYNLNIKRLLRKAGA